MRRVYRLYEGGFLVPGDTGRPDHFVTWPFPQGCSVGVAAGVLRKAADDLEEVARRADTKPA